MRPGGKIASRLFFAFVQAVAHMSRERVKCKGAVVRGGVEEPAGSRRSAGKGECEGGERWALKRRTSAR